MVIASLPRPCAVVGDHGGQGEPLTPVAQRAVHRSHRAEPGGPSRPRQDVQPEAHVLVHLHLEVLVHELLDLHGEERVERAHHERADGERDEQLDEGESPAERALHQESRKRKEEIVVPCLVLKAASS